MTEEVGLDPKRLYVTAFSGGEKYGLPRDEESAEIWKELFSKKGIDSGIVDIGTQSDGYRKGMRANSISDGSAVMGRIFYYDADKNWWSRAGAPENMPEGEPGGLIPKCFMISKLRTTRNTGLIAILIATAGDSWRLATRFSCSI